MFDVNCFIILVENSEDYNVNWWTVLVWFRTGSRGKPNVLFNEPSGTTKDRTFCDQINGCIIFERDQASLSRLLDTRIIIYFTTIFNTFHTSYQHFLWSALLGYVSSVICMFVRLYWLRSNWKYLTDFDQSPYSGPTRKCMEPLVVFGWYFCEWNVWPKLSFVRTDVVEPGYKVHPLFLAIACAKFLLLYLIKLMTLISP